MIVYHPKETYRALELFSVFIDFIIHQLNEDKVEIEKKVLVDHKLCRLKIVLVKGDDIKEEIKIGLEYNPVWGYEVSTPIERFSFELSQGVISKLSARSQKPSEYDKMLELFHACMNYLNRHDPERHAYLTKQIDFESLKRANWKKSKAEIEAELAKNTDLQIATQDLENKRSKMFLDLEGRYRSQGYEITG